MKIAQPIINEIMPESSALLILRGAHKLFAGADKEVIARALGIVSV